MDVDVLPAPPPSPWLTLWFSPRRTIRGVIDAEVRPSWWPVVALAAFGQAVAALQFDFSGAIDVSASFMPVVIGALQMVFGVLVGPFLLAFVGSWFGGEADPVEVRHAVAWSYLPVAVAGVCWVPAAVSYSRNLAAGGGIEVPLIVGALLLVGAVWSIVAQVITLAEVHKFSIGRAIASILILAIPALLLRGL